MMARAPRLGVIAVGWLAAAAGACIENPRPATLQPEDTFSLGQGKLFVTYRSDDRVAIIDPATLAVERLIQVGADPFLIDGPHEAILGPDAESYFVTVGEGPRAWGSSDGVMPPPDGGCPPDQPHCQHMGGSVPGAAERYRLADNAFLGRAEAGLGAAQIAITPDGSKMYVTSFTTKLGQCGSVTVINPRTMTRIRRIEGLPTAPHGIAITPDGSKVVVATYWDHLVVINTADDTWQEIAAGPAPAGRCENVRTKYRPNTVAISPDGRRAYVTLALPSEVIALDLTTTPPALVPDFRPRTTGSPQQVAITADSSTLVVACDGNHFVDVIDVATKTVASVDIGRPSGQGSGVADAFGLTVHPNGQLAYVAAGCGDYRGGGPGCSTPQGALVEIGLAKPPEVRRKIRLGAGVVHVTFGSPPPSPPTASGKDHP